MFTLKSIYKDQPHSGLKQKVMNNLLLFGWLLLALLALSTDLHSQVVSPFTSVFSQNQKGEIVFVGNTLMSCSSSDDDCSDARNGGNDQNNDFSMVRVDVDGDGSTNNSSRADFTLPPGASVLWAGLYWGGVSTSSSRNQVKFSTPASGGYINITGTVSSTSYGYQGFADVTSYVQAGGSGTYTTGGVRLNTGSNTWGGWSLIIVIQDPSELLRNLTVFNGLALVNTSNPNVTFTINGFKTPLTGSVNTQLGVLAYDGDKAYTGDRFKLNTTTVTNSLNSSTDFFNSTISTLNSHVTTKNPNYVNQLGYDADIADASNIIPNGDTSASVTLTTSSESYIPGAVTTAIELFAPDVQTTKSGRDINGGFLEPGDTIEYTMASTNIGNDGATLLVLKDTIPSIATYVSGSLAIVSGANAGSKSDGTGDDQADYNSGSKVVTFRLGTGANSSSGGTLLIGDSATVRFRMRIVDSAADQSSVHNQGTLSFTSATLSQPFVVKSFSADTVVVWASDLKVYKTASATTLQAGSDFTYYVKIKNFGKKDATSVVLGDTIPSGITYVSSSASQGTYSTSTGRWTVGTIAYGDSATLTFQVNATQIGTKKNKALIVQSTLPEPTPWDDSSSVTVTIVDTVAPAAPFVSSPANGSYINTTSPTITGIAEALSKVYIYIDGVLKDSTTADGSGNWSESVSGLSQGSHTVKAKAKDAAGNLSEFSSTNTFMVDTVSPNTPNIVTPSNGYEYPTSTPVFTGTAEANIKVLIYIDNILIDSTVADGSGNWSYTYYLDNGNWHHLKVRGKDLAGNTSSLSSQRNFRVSDSTPPPAPVVLTPANGSATNDITPLITGTSDPYNKIRIYIDGVLRDSVTATSLGTWSYTSPTLALGSHNVKTTSVDPAGNTSGYSNTNSFTVDTTAPSAPVVVVPANGSTVTTTTPVFSGTSEANVKIRIYVDGVLVDSTTSDGSGSWSDTSAALSQGSHTVKATAVDAAGNTSGYSNTNTFTVDSVSPNVPVVVAPANGGTVATTTPTFSGTADANVKVRIYVDGVLVDSTTANGSGAWSKASAALSQGSHNIKATAVDAVGNASGFSNTNTFTVDTVAPSAPTVATPANGSTVATTTPLFSGTAEANSKVRIYVDGVLRDSTTANGSGAWSDTSAALSQGSHNVKVTATDAVGNTSVYSNINTFTVDTNAPAAPTVAAPANGSYVTTTTPVFSGTAEANAKVRIYVDGVLVDSTTANGSGAWSDTSAALSQGSHNVKVTATDAAGNTSVYSNTNTFTVDTVAPTTPTVAAPANGSTVATTTPTFSGTAEANATVRIYVDGLLVDSTTANGSGAWSKASAALSQGGHTVKVKAVDAAGNVSGFSSTNAFTVDTVAPSAPTVAAPPNGSTVTTTTPTFSGTAEANAKVRIYVDGVLVDSTTADGSGAWSKTSAALSQGSHNVKATAVDAAGNASGYSSTNTFTVDTVAPNAPVVTAPANGATVATTTPTLSGTAEANAKVRIYVDGALVDSTTADGSGNWSKTSAALSQGSHNVKATAVDAADNVSGLSNINTFTVDTVAPNAPVVTTPADGSLLATTTPTFSGTAEANVKIRIYVDGVLVDSTTADGSGAWSKTNAALSQGSHTVKATAVDAAGNASGYSNTNAFTVDSVAPSAPTVAAPANGSTVGTTTPTYSGTAEANAKVRIYVDDVLVDSTTADGSGNWSIASAALSQGSHTVKTTATDAAGNTSGFSSTNTFTVDTVIPNAPVVVNPADGSVVATTTPTFSGTAEANSKVRIYVDGVLVDSTTANGSGAWSKTSAALAQGSHTLKAKSVDAAGNVSGFSNTNTFTVDTNAPSAPVVSAPINNSTVGTTTPTVSGTAEANSKVKIYVDNVLVDSATADGSGNWSLTSPTLAEGSHTVKATSTDAAGNTSSFSTTVAFTVDTTAPGAPVVSAPADGSTLTTTTPTFSGTAEANSKVRIYVDGSLVDSTTANGSGAWSKASAALSQGSHTIKVTATDEAGNTSGFSNTNTFTVDTQAPNAPVVTLPADGSTVATTTPTFSGTAEANSKVRLYVDGSLVDSTTADGSGAWSKASSALSQGSHTIKVTATDAAGNTSVFSNTNTFTVDTSAPNAPVVASPADGSTIATTTPTFSGTAEANSKVRIYVDGSLVDSTTADGSGNWSKASAALSQGSHTVKATATDAVGNTSGFSNTNTFTVDTVAPNAPVVTTPADGSTIGTTTPTLSGTAEANSKVRVYVDGVLVDSVTANGSGAWSIVSAALTQGSHTVKATSTDAVGNTSGYSSTNTFTVDTAAPSAPVVAMPLNGSTIATSTPTFSGTAEANSKVRIYVDGTLKDSTTANGSGNWSAVSATLNQGSHSVKATSTDAAGNTSGFSNTNTFTVNTGVPTSPVIASPVNNSSVATTTPVISGTADPNDTVKLYVDGNLVATILADGSGNWSYTSAALGEGAHTVYGTATNAAGTTSPDSPTTNFTVDTTAPTAPVVAAPADGSLLATTTPTFSGTAEANSKVRLYVDGSLVDSTTADGSGNWSKTSTTLAQGSHTIKATSTDAAGNTSGFSNTNTFTIDTAAPTAPVVATPADGSALGTTTPLFSGTAESNSKVRIYVDGSLVDSTTADGSGNWSKTSTALAQGSHSVKATSTDAAGNTSGFSNTNIFTIDSVAPTAPVVAAPANGSTLATTTPTFSGTAEANSKVRIYVDDVLVDSTTADGSGNWSIASAALSQGSHSIKATATDAVGNTSGYSNTNTFTVDTVAPNAPMATTPADGSTVSTATPTLGGTAEASTKVRIYVDSSLVDSTTADGSGNWSKTSAALSQGSHTLKATSIDAAGNTSVFSNTNTFTVDTDASAAPVVLLPADNSTVTTATPTFSGTAEANSNVRLYVDGSLVDSATADGSGNWSKTSASLSQGIHTIKATSTDNAGNTSGFSNTNTFTVDSAVPDAPVVVTPADGSTLATTTPTFSGTAEANTKVRLYVDGTLADSTTADGSGTWTKGSAALSQGSHTIKATSTDAAGNSSGFSNINTFTIDTNAPNAPVVATPVDGSAVGTTTPTFSGTAEANSKVRIYVDGSLVDSTITDGSGTWSKQSAALSEGSHTIKATSTDAAGNTSTFSNTNTFTVDTSAPGAPIVTAPVDGSTISTSTPALIGTAEANSMVRLYVDGSLVDSTTANGSGNWSKASAVLAEGSHTIKATSTDAVGNTSGFSNTNTFTVDTGAPNAPVVVSPSDNSYVTTTPTFSGTAEANTTVRLYVDGSLVDSTTADGSGNWSKASAALSQGSHTIKATSTDAVGNTSGFSNTNTFTVDTNAPNAPVVQLPADGSIIGTTTPTFSGMAEANSKVRLYVDNVLADSTTAGGSGNWSKVSAALAVSSHTIKATATDAAGNTSGFSNTNTFTINTTPPALTITGPVEGEVTNDNTPTITGTTEPNLTVIILVDGNPVDTVVADGSGNWTSTISTPLGDGSHELTVSVTNSGGITAEESVTFSIDTVPPSVAITEPAGEYVSGNEVPVIGGTSEPNATLVIFIDGVPVDTIPMGSETTWITDPPGTLSEGSHTITVTATDTAGNTTTVNKPITVDTTPPSVAVSSPADGGTTTDNTPTISGTSEPGIEVVVFVDGVPIDTVVAAGGTWTTDAPSLSDGSHSVYAVGTDPAGNETTSPTNNFSIDHSAPSVAITTPANGSSTNNTQPPITGTAEVGSTVILSLDSSPVDTFVIPVSGSWSYNPPSPLSAISHTATATATDSVGNSASATSTFTIDTTPPTVSVTSPTDGALLGTNTPTFTGTAEPFSTVRLYVDGSLVTTFAQNGSGVWSFISGVLTQGAHTIYATATDAATNMATSSTVNFSIDNILPAVSVITPVNGSTSTDNTPFYSGTAEVGTTVRVYIDSVLTSMFTQDATGAWSFEGTVVTDGFHRVYASATDNAGNVATSSLNVFRIVTLPVLTNISPSTKRVGEGTFTMTLTGNYFLPTSEARLDGSPRTTTFVSQTQLLVEIPSTDLELVDTFDVTVFTPASVSSKSDVTVFSQVTGGGTSDPLPFAVRGSTISGTIFFDGNKDGLMNDNDFGVAGWAVNAEATNPVNNRLVTSDANGVYTFTDLYPDTYTLTEVSKPLWTAIAPSSGSYTIAVTTGFDTTGLNYANFAYVDTGSFRTFKPSDLIEKKAISRKKCNGFRFAFEFTNSTGKTANGIYVEYNNVVTEHTQFYPFEEVQDLGQNAQDYKYLGTEIQNGETVRIEGYSAVTPCRIRISKWWWLWNDTNISRKRSEGSKKTSWLNITLPMPNVANARDEVFSSGQVISYGLIAGIEGDRTSRKYAWVDIRKSTDLLGSLYDKKIQHTGTPRGFTNGTAKGAIIGRIKKLPPSKFNNRMFAELLTLKFNIWASVLGATPPGFGELVYEEAGNPLRGMMIKDIGKKADTMMTYWENVPESLYINMDTTLNKLNLAFSGPIDTFQFALRTKLKGIKPLSEVSFLRPNFVVPPMIASDQDILNSLVDEMPEKFQLYQNYPNPFNPSTTISFDLPAQSAVTIKLYDILGKEIATLLNNEEYEFGAHAVEFVATDLPSGVYFYRINAKLMEDTDNFTAGQEFEQTKKMMLVK